MLKALLSKLKDAAVAALPIVALVIILSLALPGIRDDYTMTAGGKEIFMPGIDGWYIGLFAVGAVLLVIGMAFFTLGADVAMMPIGNDIGAMLSKKPKNRIWFVILVALVIGFVITIAEPDLIFLADQLKSKAVIYIVAVGVGLSVVISVLRTLLKIKLKYVLFCAYFAAFALAGIITFVNPEFLAVSFDSGGITTGPITVPFLMALGIGIASVRGSKNQDDSFGMVALCTIGPVIAMLILGLSGAVSVTAPATEPMLISSVSGIFTAFGKGLLAQMSDVGVALLPIAAVFIIFQITDLKLPRRQVLRIAIGIVYTFIGLTVFLAAVNVGFTPIGKMLGSFLGMQKYRYVLVPLGVLMGFLIVLAEPAIHVLNKQVEEITGGAISRKMMLVTLCLGIAIAVGLAMLRVVSGISIWYFLIPVYGLSLILMFFVPSLFANIAFDSGGVASGPMTATFLLPFATGACAAIGGNILTDAFGMAAFVSMMPLLLIQLVGLVFKLKTKHINRTALATAVHTAEEELGLPAIAETADFDTEVFPDKGKGEGVSDYLPDSGDTADTVDFDE